MVMLGRSEKIAFTFPRSSWIIGNVGIMGSWFLFSSSHVNNLDIDIMKKNRYEMKIEQRRRKM